jgi:hypothetical protein
VRGLLLDPTTGRPDGDTRVPESGEVAAWKRELAERGVRDQLRRSSRFPGLQGTTTTNRYLCTPAAANGLAITSGAGVWTFSTPYTQVVAASGITATFYLVGICFQPAAASAVTTTNEYLFELATGGSGSEVTACQLPFTVRNVTAAGYIPPAWIALPEPKQVAANTRVAARLAASVASLATTGFKLIYETA